MKKTSSNCNGAASAAASTASSFDTRVTAPPPPQPQVQIQAPQHSPALCYFFEKSRLIEVHYEFYLVSFCAKETLSNKKSTRRIVYLK